MDIRTGWILQMEPRQDKSLALYHLQAAALTVDRLKMESRFDALL